MKHCNTEGARRELVAGRGTPEKQSRRREGSPCFSPRWIPKKRTKHYALCALCNIALCVSKAHEQVGRGPLCPPPLSLLSPPRLLPSFSPTRPFRARVTPCKSALRDTDFDNLRRLHYATKTAWTFAAAAATGLEEVSGAAGGDCKTVAA